MIHPKRGVDMNISEQVREQLFIMADEGHRAFHSKLIPNIDPALIIGVRMPQLRAYAKQFGKTPEARSFLSVLPHTYYEENNLHALLIEQLQAYDQLIAALDAFLPWVDNWATCDLLRPKVLKQHRSGLREQIRLWLASEHPYTVRFALEMLMVHFLEEDFCPEYLSWAAELDREEYYVRMMVAWYFATALAKQYDAALPFLQERRLARWTHNKTIQKAVESYRITEDQKNYLRTLRY